MGQIAAATHTPNPTRGAGTCWGGGVSSRRDELLAQRAALARHAGARLVERAGGDQPGSNQEGAGVVGHVVLSCRGQPRPFA